MTYEAGTWTMVNGTSTYSYGRLWVGDSLGQLYALDGSLRPTANTPVQPKPGDAVQTTPVVYTDSVGDPYVLFGTYGASSQQLWVFDPTKAVGQANPAAVDTGQTAISQLSATVTNGVVYAAGRRTDHRQPGNRPGFRRQRRPGHPGAARPHRGVPAHAGLRRTPAGPTDAARRPRPATRPI
jgi:outer membrane protein assembly factor BamB